MRNMASLCVLALLLTGCTEAQVSFQSEGSPPDGDVPTVRVTYLDGFRGGTVLLHGSDRKAGPISTQQQGELRLLCELLGADGQPAAQGNITLPLKSDWGWGVSFFVHDAPCTTEGCFGCFGSTSFPVAADAGFGEGKILCVLWGGNSLKNPVIY